MHLFPPCSVWKIHLPATGLQMTDLYILSPHESLLAPRWVCKNRLKYKKSSGNTTK